MAQIKHDLNEIPEKMWKRLQSFEQPLTSFYMYLIRKTDLTFRTLGRSGSGSFRGVSWPWFSPIRTRKGKLISPVGRRVRHSGQKVHESSRIMQDTGHMARAALAQYRITNHFLEADTPVKYAKYQQAARPFAFVTDEDANYLRGLINKHIIQDFLKND